MLSLEDKGLFKLYSLQVMPAENVQPQPRSTQNSQMDAIRDMLNNVDKGVSHTSKKFLASSDFLLSIYGLEAPSPFGTFCHFPIACWL